MTNDDKTIFEDVEAFLKEKGAGDFDADYIHGYITAVACAPSPLDWEIWPAHFFKSEHGSGNVLDDEDLQDVQDAVLQAYDDVTYCLLDGDYLPHIMISKDPAKLIREDAKKWSDGFLYGTKLWDTNILKSDTELLSNLAFIHIFNNSERVTSLTGDAKDKIGGFEDKIKEKNPAVLISFLVSDLYKHSVHKMGNKYPDLNKALNDILKYDMKPEFVHGFMSSLACSPVMIKPSVWMDKLWEGYEDPIYDSTEAALFVYNALLGIYDKVERNADLLGSKVQLIESEDNIEAVQPWAAGFCKGCDLWQHRADMKERFNIEFKIADYYAHNGQVAEDFFKGYEEAEGRISENTPLRNLNSVIFELQTRYRNQTPLPFKNDVKMGRNDPCPCGSGKKYKKCCGK
ncbi:MAG TPA: UPF0149 family protein [Clostridiales bacterium]|nr:UPF0149 family protein [Clostridiales bacterium]HQP70272.1 UPF0149 family protein [Clostridiales bacterium]